MWESVFRLLTELSSRPSLARFAGWFAKTKASRRLIPKFSSLYRIRVDEAEYPLEAYESLNDFFIRRLKQDARPIDPDPRSVVSPVDGTVTEAGIIGADQTFTVKGQTYTVSELLNQSPHAARFGNGYFLVIYLSPANYHRIHAPVEAAVTEVDRIPGKTYPVNDASMRRMKRVLARNTRLVTYLKHVRGTLALVKVGAMNVGSIHYANGGKPPEKTAKGEELAYFEFGSTVVLLWEPNNFTPISGLEAGRTVRMGEKIGEIAGGE